MTLAPLQAVVTLDEATHTYVHVDGHRPPSVTQVLGSVPPWFGRFERVDPATLEYKRNLGSQVHRATQYFDDNTLDQASVDPAIQPYLDAWIRFRHEKNFSPLVTEGPIYHPFYGYAGTLDRFGTVDAPEGYRYVLLDIKTGEGSMAGPQTAAYLEAFSQEHNLSASVVWRWTVQLKPDGAYALTPHHSRRDFRVFLAALELYTYARSRH